MTKKEKRKFIYDKYDGHCYLCGCDLNGIFHIDELLPVRRKMKWNKDKTEYIWDGTYEHQERLNIDNQMPACPSCNINKHSMSLEEFRKFIQNFIVSLNRDSTQYKIAKRYNLIQETNNSVLFYYEMKYKLGQKLEFNIYGTIVEGGFIRMDDNKIVIKTTKDIIVDIGKEQSINKDFLTLTSTGE